MNAAPEAGLRAAELLANHVLRVARGDVDQIAMTLTIPFNA